MRKSIFAYWTVFTGRFIDNLHMRLQYNLVFELEKELASILGRKFAPIGGEEFSEEARVWMEEPLEARQKRNAIKADLDKIQQISAEFKAA